MIRDSFRDGFYTVPKPSLINWTVSNWIWGWILLLGDSFYWGMDVLVDCRDSFGDSLQGRFIPLIKSILVVGVPCILQMQL
jgi:hypothetical protein